MNDPDTFAMWERVKYHGLTVAMVVAWFALSWVVGGWGLRLIVAISQ